MSADELARFAALYRVRVEWLSSGEPLEGAPADEGFFLWMLCCYSGRKPPGGRGPRKRAADPTPSAGGARTPPHGYIQCAYQDGASRDPRAWATSCCPVRIALTGEGEASYYCAQHQSRAPGAEDWRATTSEEWCEFLTRTQEGGKTVWLFKVGRVTSGETREQRLTA